MRGKRVLLRLDLNVPLLPNGEIGKAESYRLEASLPTLKYLLDKKAKVIILTHLGRPDGKIVNSLRLDPVAKALGRLLGQQIMKLDDAFGKATKLALDELPSGHVAMLENLRFYPGEEENDIRFARELAKYGDVYVNDAFAVCHRVAASVVSLAKVLPSYAGLWLEREVKELTKLLTKPSHPAVAVFGGAKISTKIKVIENIIKKFDVVFLTGGLANTLFLAKGFRTGKSLVEKSELKTAKQLLKSKKVILPDDVVVVQSLDRPWEAEVRVANDIRPRELVVDIGPETIHKIWQAVSTAKMVLWNGPLGCSEKPSFAKGTDDLVRAIIHSLAYAVAGGGETVEAIRRLKAGNSFSFLSTGGGAMLEFLSGRELPGIKTLKR
ncbi:MAG: phosphoglycerate kinase [bacterium]